MDIANNLPLSMDIAFFLTASGEWKKCYWRVQMLMDIAKKIMRVSFARADMGVSGEKNGRRNTQNR